MENSSKTAREVMDEILAQIKLATTYSQIEYCQDDFQKRFLSVFCPTQDDAIIQMVDQYHEAIYAKEDSIRGPRSSEF